MPRLRYLLPLICVSFVFAGVACDSGSGDRATVDVVAGAREEQSPPPTTASEAEGGPRALLPDLVVRQPGELYIQDGDDGVREIRFSTSVVNVGEGPLEMLGAYEEETDKTLASQRVLYADGTTTEREIGRFLFHPDHDHWHFEDFTVFELWSVDDNRDLVDLVATTGKLTFCLVDEYPVDEPPANGVAEPAMLECNSGAQGLSVGWEETYLADFPGQELDIPEVPDGTYVIRT
ncbi:MAG: lysyl oxidase family protein, partial [Dehalococcoidia bacterium]